MAVEKCANEYKWMVDELYGFSDSKIVEWNHWEDQIRRRFRFTESAHEQLHEFLKQKSAPLNELIDTLSRTVNESYYGQDNFGFYEMGIQGRPAQMQFFLDNAAKEERKPTAIKNGNCNNAVTELRKLIETLGNKPGIHTAKALARYKLPKNYQSETEQFFYHANTIIYDEERSHWCLLNSYTPRNNTTLIPKESIPRVIIQKEE